MAKRIFHLLIIAMLAMSLGVSYVLALPIGAQIDDQGAAETGTTTAAGTYDTEGGNITSMNISGFTITGRWAGFYGEVSGGVFLTDGASNVFYEWTIDDVTNSVVYAANATISSWTSVNRTNISYMPSFITSGTTDNFTRTFNNTGNFNSSSLNISNVLYTSTWQNGVQGVLYTYSLREGNNLIWAGKAIADTNAFRPAATVDYQILVPADTTPITYNFYLELP